MPRIDDYISARKLAVETLTREALPTIVRRTGFELVADDRLRVPFLDRTFEIQVPGFEFTDPATPEREVPIQEQILILHYMLAGDNILPTGNWISYREIPGASFYFSAFPKRAVDPLKKVFGQNIDGFKAVAGRIGGRPIDAGDAAFEFELFPRIALQAILWEGDEEFTPEANILFDEIIGELLSAEDIAWLSGMLIYRLMALAR